MVCVCGGVFFLQFCPVAQGVVPSGQVAQSCDVCVNFHYINSLVFGFCLCVFFLFNPSLCEWFSFKKIILKHFCVL